ncbi:PAP2-domain-containing protein [Obba rivulosa]|uniref:PAP2-domain-containing protein n=1 Tax=Obba rivulosa TaxID=1052685 RepID=A0A8E2DVQ1_9APHY|nr:PAP2-domain-containing protein [Obba rivulosa]
MPDNIPLCVRLLDKTNSIVTSLTAAFILYTRSAGAVYFAAGAVLCSITVKIVKRFVRQERPVQTITGRRKKTYGMPSTHSAVITYYAVYSALACTYLPIHPLLPMGEMSRTIPVLVVVPWAVTVAVSRIWLGHHTWPQVAAGCTYGALFAPLWFRLWTSGANGYGRMLEHAFFG